MFEGKERLMTKAAYFDLSARDVPAPSGCPVDHGFSPFNDSYVADPYAALAAKQVEVPVFYAANLGYLVLTRMEDVAEVLRRSDDFASTNVQHPVHPVGEAAAAVLASEDFNPQPVLSNQGDPVHSRVRKHAMAGFSGRRMRLLEPVIRDRCEALVDELLSGGSPGEFTNVIGHRLPGETIYRLVGFPQADDPQLFDWSTDRLDFTWGRTDEDAQVAIAESMVAYWRYCVAHVERCRTTPGDDLTSELVAVHAEDPDALSRLEIASVLYGLSFAGHEIVSYFLANSLIRLLDDRVQWEAICADPSLIPGAAEEILRFDSPQTSWRRVAVRDTAIAKIEIPQGTQLFLSLASANHDPTLFEDPDSFDIHRDNARSHISFGRGMHFCLGNRLATIQAVIMLETMTARVPGLALAPDRDISYIPNFTLRGPRELWLTW